MSRRRECPAPRGGVRRAAAATAVAAPVARASWLINPFWDFVLFVGTPLLILPAITVAERIWPVDTLYITVAAFGALGHHLPGMMRAYGDRRLFQRFKVRFIVAPIFLIVACAWLSVRDNEALFLLVYGWGVWHGLMQTHGFLRIYDGKWASFGRMTARLDQLMCITWFGAAVLFSSSRMQHILDNYYKTGGPLIPAEAIAFARSVALGLALAVTLAYVLNALRAWRAGQPQSPIKHLLLVTSVGWWWYCNVTVGNILLGLLLFELFHDSQYLTIVWLFNRRRAETDPEAGWFTRTIFRQRIGMVFVYLGLIALYGLFGYLPERTHGYAQGLLGSILLTSTLLHFYFDGFIWKMREKDTRGALGLAGDRDDRSREVVASLRHAALWSLFVIPAAVFLYLGPRTGISDSERHRQVAAAVPEQPEAQFNLGIVLATEGNLEGAVEANRVAWAHRGDVEARVQSKLQNNLTATLTRLARERVKEDRVEEARPLLLEARDANPQIIRALQQNGLNLARTGDAAAAAVELRSVLLVEPENADARALLARIDPRNAAAATP